MNVLLYSVFLRGSSNLLFNIYTLTTNNEENSNAPIITFRAALINIYRNALM